MTEALPSVIKRGSPIAQKIRPLLDETIVIKAEVLDSLKSLGDDLEQLRQGAQRIVVEARKKAQTIEEEAQHDGRVQGLRKWQREVARVRAEYARIEEQAERDMVTLAFHVAKRLIGHAIDVRPEIVQDMVGQVLTNARGRRQIVVHVHPSDYEVVRQQRDEFARQLDGTPVYFEAHSSLERGGCIIETESGRIDARLETQLQVLQDALLGNERGSSGGEE